MKASRYASLIGRTVVVYSSGLVFGPVTLIRIEPGEHGGHFVIEFDRDDRATVRRRGTTLRPY